MLRRVVDSNVPIVANGRDINASPGCRLKAIEMLARLLGEGQIIVDADGAMMEEYRRYCEPKGQPGVGDRFFREILMNYEGRVDRIPLPKNVDGEYIDFPNDPELADFDPDDRKFAAAARRSNCPVLNATDSDWIEALAALERNGIQVDFVCGTNQNTWTI
jgi:hypothetical protein